MKKVFSFTVINLILLVIFSACEQNLLDENKVVSTSVKEKSGLLFAMYAPKGQEEIILREVGGPKCTVKGKCSAAFCSAEIECGCDESPKCKCTLLECKCDCEKKGQSGGGESSRLIVGMTEEQYNDALDFHRLLKQLHSQQSRIAYGEFTGYINAIVNANYTGYRAAGVSTRNALTLLPANEKNTVNQWFIDHNFEERI